MTLFYIESQLSGLFSREHFTPSFFLIINFFIPQRESAEALPWGPIVFTYVLLFPLDNEN